MAKKDQMDIKRDRFIRIAEKRVNNILCNLSSLGNCSNKRNYTYNEQDVKKIFLEIEKKIKEIKSKFQDTANNEKVFKL